MHNMMIESEHMFPSFDDYPYDHQGSLGVVHHQVPVDFGASCFFFVFFAMHTKIRDVDAHAQF
jgi:hypothetical protein